MRRPRNTSPELIARRLAMIEGLCREDQVTVIVMYMREHGDKVEAAAQAMTRGFALGAVRR
jgi:hypothetical protein